MAMEFMIMIPGHWIGLICYRLKVRDIYRAVNRGNVSLVFPVFFIKQDAMMKSRQTATAIFLFSLLCGISVPSFASDDKITSRHLSIGIGWEQIFYEEHEPELLLESEATVSNLVLNFEMCAGWRKFLFGIKGAIPAIRDANTEEWTVAGNLTQTNLLENGWTRVDGFIGYPIAYPLYTYIGFRFSEVRQERTDFVNVFGPSVAPITVTETVTANYLLFGLMGSMPLKPRWSFGYGFEYLMPFYSEITNSAFPGWYVSSINGYSIALSAQLEYVFSERISLIGQLNGGQHHWDGSDWQLYENRSVKWPQNDTYSWAGIITIKTVF